MLSRSKDSLNIQLIIFPVEIYIVRIRHLLPACVHILRTYTSNFSVPHLMCSLLVESDWDSSQMVIKKVLSVRQQPALSWQKKFWDFIVNSWTRFSTVRLVESGPNSGGHLIPLLETEKICCLSVD